MKVNIKWIQYLSFIAIGIISNIMGPLLPTIREELVLSYGQLGMLLSETFLGMLLMALAGGYIMDKYGKKPFLFAGGLLLFFGLIGTTLSSSFKQLYILNFITSMGFGIYEVGINALCADYSGEEKGNDMNFLHFFYGLGAILGPIFALIWARLGNWRLCFGISGIFPLVITILIIMFKGDKINASANSAVEESFQAVPPLKSMLLWTTGITVFIYVGLEVSVSGWIPTFWKSMVTNSIIPPSLATTLFWIAMTCGRLMSGKIADRIGLLKFIFMTSSLAMAVSLTWTALPAGIWTLISILLVGIFLAGIYPTIMAYSTAAFPKNTGLTAAFISVFGALGGAFVPSAIGKMSDSFGIGILSISILGLSLILTAFSVLLWRKFYVNNSEDLKKI